MMRYSWRGWSIVAACAFELQACAAGAPVRRPASGPVRLRVLVLPSLSAAPLFVAADGGYFARQGLDVEFVKVTRSTDALLALSRGELDVWTGSVSLALLNAIGRDAGIKVVSDAAYMAPTGCAYGALVVRRSLVERHEVNRPADLRGRRVALNPSSSPGYLMEKLLGQSGLTLGDITVVDLPGGVVVSEALRNGSVDAAFVLEPWVTRTLQAEIGVILASAGQVAPNYQHLVTAYGPSLLKGDPEVGRRFMAAYLEAVAQYSEGKSVRNIQILARHTGLDEDLLRKACWPSVRSDGRVDAGSMLEFQSWGLRRQLLDHELTPGQLWDSAFVDYVNQAR
jgi:NitT/TauT family transport system substrate-binding protein